jgi:hypothetical protein
MNNYTVNTSTTFARPRTFQGKNQSKAPINGDLLFFENNKPPSKRDAY